MGVYLPRVSASNSAMDIILRIFMLVVPSITLACWSIMVLHGSGFCREAVALVWATITLAFGYNCVMLGRSHVSMIVWLIAWILSSCFLAYNKGVFKMTRASSGASCDSRKQTAKNDFIAVAATTITVSVRLPSGEEVLPDTV